MSHSHGASLMPPTPQVRDCLASLSSLEAHELRSKLGVAVTASRSKTATTFADLV